MLEFITSKLHNPIGSDALLISVYFIVMSLCKWPGPFSSEVLKSAKICKNLNKHIIFLGYKVCMTVMKRKIDRYAPD